MMLNKDMAFLTLWYNQYLSANLVSARAYAFDPATSNLPTGTDDDKMYAYPAGLAIDLYGNDKNWDSLDLATRGTIVSMIASNSMAGYMAGGISEYLETGRAIWPLPVYDTAEYSALGRKAV